MMMYYFGLTTSQYIKNTIPAATLVMLIHQCVSKRNLKHSLYVLQVLLHLLFSQNFDGNTFVLLLK